MRKNEFKNAQILKYVYLIKRNNLRKHFTFNPDRFHLISPSPYPSKLNLYKTSKNS